MEEGEREGENHTGIWWWHRKFDLPQYRTVNMANAHRFHRIVINTICDELPRSFRFISFSVEMTQFTSDETKNDFLLFVSKLRVNQLQFTLVRSIVRCEWHGVAINEKSEFMWTVDWLRENQMFQFTHSIVPFTRCIWLRNHVSRVQCVFTQRRNR